MESNRLLNEINIHNSWAEFIESDYIRSILNDIEMFLFNKYKNINQTNNSNDIKNIFFPHRKNVLRFLTNDLKNIKYIILGMDPYPSYYIEDNKVIPVATGRSFELSNVNSFLDKYKQTSMMNILKTLYYDKFGVKTTIENIRKNSIEISDLNIINNLKKLIKESKTKNDLIAFAKKNSNILNDKLYLFNMKDFYDITELQGVLWLNATLTVEVNKSGSHEAIWKEFVNELIKHINKNTTAKWVVWGNDAKDRISNYTNNIIYNCHPATRVNNNFIEANSFQYMNDILFYI